MKPPGITSFLENRVKQIVFYLLLSLIATQGFADNVTLPHTFSPGEIVSSSKVNENFSSLAHAINQRHQGYEAVVFFITLKKFDGNLGGRSGADLKCKNDQMMMFVRDIRPICEPHAFISVSDNDETRDIITNYNLPEASLVLSPSKFVLSDNLTHMLFYNNSETMANIEEIGIFQHYYIGYWTGSYRQGEIYSKNCQGFTSSNSGVQGHYGQFTDGNIHFSSEGVCDSELNLLCFCY